MKKLGKTITHILALCLLLVAASGSSRAASYDVGPVAGYLAKLSDVPWGTLKPGDIVNIHYKAGGYHEIIHISQAGTQANPIIIRGVPDPVTGALPVIDGKDAIMDPHVDFRSPVFENFGVFIVSARKKGYVYGQTFPSWINIETLNIKNALYKADSSITFTDVHGKTRIFDSFACGIYIEFARHIAIRGCEISFNGNGIFANSKNQAAQSSQDLLIEKNYIHDNGQPSIPGLSNGFHEHNCYIEADGVVYQYNRFGPLRAHCHGTMIKDRSAGTIIRYNEVLSSECSNIFAILDPQGGAGYLELKPYYQDAYVYGNVITMKAGPANQSSIVWFGAYNGAAYYPAEHRGTLYFYNNTVVNHQNGCAAFELTDLPYAPSANIYEKVDCRNNIFYTDSAINANPYQAFKMVITGANGVVDMEENWVSPKTTKLWLGHEGGSVVNGWANQLFGDANGANNPGFTDLVGGVYTLAPDANSVDAAGTLAPSALALGYDITEQYKPHRSHKPRVVLGLASDLGAYEGVSSDTIIAVKAVSGAIGATKTLSGVLTHWFTGAPIANRPLVFSVGALVLGTALTDANGKATLSFKLPESFGAGQQTLVVKFAGDATYRPSNGQGVLTVLQAPAKVSVSSTSGKIGAKVTLKIKLTRATDGAVLDGKTVRFLIDGAEVGTGTTVAGIATLSYVIPNSLTAGAHAIGGAFDGDAAYLNAVNNSGILTVKP